MLRGTLRSLVNRHCQEAGSNNQIAYENAAVELDSLFEANQISPDEFSVQAIFEELVGPMHQWREAQPQHIAEAISSTAFPQITNKIFHNALIPEYERQVGALAELVTEDQATRTVSDEVPGFTPIDGDLEKRDEFMPYLETDFGEKRIRIKMADFGRVISVSREAIFDDRTGQLLNRCRAIGELAGQHRAKMIVQTIEMLPRTAFGESTVGAYVYKGTNITQANFYRADHSAVTGLDGQVNNNILTGAPDTPTYTDLLDVSGSMTNENGDPIDVALNNVLAPKKLLPAVWRMSGSPEQPDTTNRAWNYFGPKGPGGFESADSSPYLATDYYWYVGNFKRQLLWLWVWKPESASQGASSEQAFNNQIVFRYRFNYNGGVGHQDYRYIVRCGSSS